MDDPVFKQKYQKYKLRVKMWEKDFKKKHGRIPSKYDIREASQDIRDSYKMYYKLKTSFLENTLNDVLSDDGFDILDISRREVDIDTSPPEIINVGPQLPIDITKLVEQYEDQDTTVQENSVSWNNTAEKNEKFEPVKILPLNTKAWGSNVSMKFQEKQEMSESKNKIVKKNFNEKLFQNSSFSKRNPRKSLSKLPSKNSLTRSQSNIFEDSNTSSKEVLPDLETILLQKAKEQQTAALIASNPILAGEKAKENIKTQVDEEWLERNAAQTDGYNEQRSHKVEGINSQSSTTTRKKSVYGLTNFEGFRSTTNAVSKRDQDKLEESSDPNKNFNNNIEIESQEPCNVKKMHFEDLGKFATESMPHESDSMVDDSEEEKESQEHRHIVKRKKLTSSIVKEHEICKSENHSCVDNKNETVESLKSKTKSFSRKKANAVKKVAAKENIKGSLREVKTKVGRVSKKKAIISEGLSDEDQDKPFTADDLKYTIALERGDLISIPRLEQSVLENADKVAEKYIYSVTSLSGKTSASTVSSVDGKRAVARRKLEEKIAAGKLNENFVTINIQKKKFVRGKKSVNYSKYKKKLWKHKKKIAALTGPDMDMGGCDGGILKCFNCGNAGHFAQNCKMKGDSLLPLTAQLEEDPSPFPTLEEAKQMASQSTVAVHSRNISKMPQASNAALYDTDTAEYEEEVNSSETDADSESGVDSSTKDEEIIIETDDELENFDIETAILEKRNTVSSPIKKYVGSKIPDEFLKAAGIDPTNPNSSHTNQFRPVGPLYDANPDGSVKEVTPEVVKVLKMFGHTSFRKGQDRAVMRILSGVSTLVTLSTGSGKSLCYQLPAYLYSKHKKSITLVISPLVSLMEDQVTGVPHFLRAHCLHTNQTPQQKLNVMKMIADGEIDILLVSPEAVVAGERATGFGGILRQLPPIAFACIDEVHCVSQWSHNFRPSYLMICKVLTQNLGVKCILGLTATATLPTRMSIITHLGIKDGEQGIISDTPLPDNLVLSVSKDENRDAALLRLLLSKRFEACQSIIIYCTRRDECERIAAYLRSCLQNCNTKKTEDGKRKRKRVNWHAETYHAGMPSSRRRTIQNAFMANELRIVVATIAFGMGINKPDIRAVIHYNMPRNFESYVQEIGRAGRDNKISHCHLFLDSNGGDQNELKRHIYANSLDRHVIRKLLKHIFVPCYCNKTAKDGILKSSALCHEKSMKRSDKDASVCGGEECPVRTVRVCQGHEIGFSIEDTVQTLDIPEENISTLLCYIELEKRWSINVLSNAYIQAKIISYGGPKYLKHAAKDCPPLAMAIAMQIKNGSFKDDSNIIQFSVIDVAAAIGWNSGVVKYQLKNLEWLQVNGYPKRSPVTVSFYDLGFRIKAPGDFTAEEIDDALDTLYNRSVKQEHTQLIQLQYIFQGLSSVAYNSCDPCCNETFSHDRSDQLKGIIRDYFHNDYPKSLKLDVDPSSLSDGELEADFNNLINMYPENNFSGRNIARIFHGISSPNFPAVIWHRCKFWRFHSKVDFNRIVQLANNVILRRRT